MLGFRECAMCQGTGVSTFTLDSSKDENGVMIETTVSLQCLRTPHQQASMRKNPPKIYTKQVWVASR